MLENYLLRLKRNDKWVYSHNTLCRAPVCLISLVVSLNFPAFFSINFNCVKKTLSLAAYTYSYKSR
jgi:hypothetical protein